MVTLSERDRREIGQHFVFGFHGIEVNEEIKTLIRDHHVGNIILMKRNVQSFVQVRRLTRDLQSLAKEAGHAQPLLIGIDQENGLVSAFSSSVNERVGTQFPGAMALAASGSLALAEEVSAASGLELRLAGVNWCFSPVADVNVNLLNPVIGVRSFGDDPQKVGSFANAVSRGLVSVDIAPCAKHFPGHGDTHVDSHLALPSLLKDKKTLTSLELVPFKALIHDNVASIMTGHIALPSITSAELPASLSRLLTTDLLRGEMGYSAGVIVTDCLEMQAVKKLYGTEKGAVMSLQAGADIAMICHTLAHQLGAIQATYTAIENGDLSMDELFAGGQRIAALKAKFAGSWETLDPSVVSEQDFERAKVGHAQLSARAYAASVAQIHNPNSTLPLVKDGPLLVFTPEMESLNAAVDDIDNVDVEGKYIKSNRAGTSYLDFVESVNLRRKSTHFVYTAAGSILPLPAAIRSAVEEATAVIFVTRNANTSAWQLSYLRQIKITTSAPIVLLSSCGPYDILGVEDMDLPHIMTFEHTHTALKTAAALIFGGVQCSGNHRHESETLQYHTRPELLTSDSRLSTMKKLFGREKPKVARAPQEVETPAVEEPLLPPVYARHRTVSPRSQSEDNARAPPAVRRKSIDEEVVTPPSEAISKLSLSPTPEAGSKLSLPPVLSSRASSYHSTALGASVPLASPLAPRSASPYGASADPASRKDREPQVLRKKPPGATVGILSALNPSLAPVGPPTLREGETGKEDKKEKKGFWDKKDKERDKERSRGHEPIQGSALPEGKKGREREDQRALDKERDRDLAREKEREREFRDDEPPSELIKMIGYLTATASEDWALVLEVCERASASEANAKDAVRALRREFKYGVPSAQLSAARLWAIMLRNSSNVFVSQSSSRKFLDVLEELLTSSSTSPVVRERLLDIVAAAAFASGPKKETRNEKDGFRALWRKVKPVDAPDEGIPFDTRDSMLNPPNGEIPPEAYREAAVDVKPLPSDVTNKSHRFSPSKNRIIPLEEDMRRLFQECKIGQGNAQLLSESLAFMKPEELKGKDIIREFYAKCQSSQELIFAQIAWATAGAERSRIARDQISQPKHEPVQLTLEEQLLAALLAANEALLEALSLYDELQHAAEQDNTTKHQPEEFKPSTLNPHVPTDADEASSSETELEDDDDDSLDASLLPPPAPHGPRSPGYMAPITNPESPTTYSVDISAQDSIGYQDHSRHLNGSGSWNNANISIQLSAKALGKQRLIPAQQHPDDHLLHLQHNDDDVYGNVTVQRQPLHYVYDAAAERTQQRIEEQHSKQTI